MQAPPTDPLMPAIRMNAQKNKNKKNTRTRLFTPPDLDNSTGKGEDFFSLNAAKKKTVYEICIDAKRFKEGGGIVGNQRLNVGYYSGF